ncbi:MAG: ABC transporter ATP-binding protein/permease [Firmicutes bacterium]|nr:ABC transporter ATP-binding protein/permease [Bacillota bacterium]
MSKKELQFNLGVDGTLVQGRFIYLGTRIDVAENGEVVKSYCVLDIEKFKVEANIGICSLLAKINGEYHIVCNFSNKYSTHFSVFTKYFNHAKKKAKGVGGVARDTASGGADVVGSSDVVVGASGAVSEGIDQSWLQLFDEDEDVKEEERKKDASIRKGTFGKMVRLMRGYRKHVAAIVGLNILTYIIIVGIPFFNTHLIDSFLSPIYEQSDVSLVITNLFPFLSHSDTLTAFFMVIGFMLGLIFIRSILHGIRNLVNGLMGHNIARDLRQSLFNKVQALSIKNFSKRSTGAIINRTVSDTERISRFLTFELVHAINQVILAVLILALLLWLNWVMALIIVVPLLIVIFALNRYFKYMRKRYNKQWAAGSKSTNTLVDILSGIRVVKVFGTEQREVERFVKTSENLRDISESNEKIWHYIHPYLMALVFIGQFIALYYGGVQYFAGNMTIGEVLFFYIVAGMLFDPLVNAANLPRWMAESMTSANKIFEILDEPDYKPKDNKTLEIEGQVDINNLTFGYKPYKTILNDVSLSAKKGDMIGIVGKTGAGKSTLVSLIMRLYTPDSGEILLDDVNLQDISEDCLRAQLGMVMQDNYLFSGSILENISYSKPDATEEEIIAAATLANAHEFIIKLEDGYNTIVGEKGYTLSGGERQRISIARALLHNPKILVLDEATSSLDTETEKDIQGALQTLTKDRTTFAIAHRLSTLRHSTKIVVIADNKIAESGTHEQLLNHKGIYYNLVQAQKEMLVFNK